MPVDAARPTPCERTSATTKWMGCSVPLRPSRQAAILAWCTASCAMLQPSRRCVTRSSQGIPRRTWPCDSRAAYSTGTNRGFRSWIRESRGSSPRRNTAGYIRAGAPVSRKRGSPPSGARGPAIHAASRGTAATTGSVASDPSILLGSGAALLALVLIAWRATYAHLKRKRATTRVMQSFAERFISEFERPLRQPGSAERPLQARMRFVQRRRRVDILLAPNGGRSYPNLTDHRRNVTYDVGRVVRLIADTRFTTGDVYARGRWVVVPCRLATEPRQEGGR